MTSSTKRCPKCGNTKAVSEFNKDASQPDGLDGWCRACRALAAKTMRRVSTKVLPARGTPP